MTEAPKFSYDSGVTLGLEGTSPSPQVSFSNKDGMDIDSESTCSCLNASSDINSVDSEGEPEFTSHNDSSIDHVEFNKCTEHDGGSPKTCTIDKNDHSPGVSEDNPVETDAEDKHMPETPEAPCSASSGSIQVINDEGGVYIVPNPGAKFDSEDHDVYK